ncbi:MAG: hypothetical protein R2856_07300 [Caldilineaceae bacterium]
MADHRVVAGAAEIDARGGGSICSGVGIAVTFTEDAGQRGEARRQRPPRRSRRKRSRRNAAPSSPACHLC